MDNLHIYNQVRKPPDEALKEIQAGRLRGKTDINPMWRLKALTEQFGICGIGWKYVITKQWLETGGKDEKAAFVNIDLFVKVNGEWSEAIPGTGGSSFVANESRGPYVSDECFKMALTDAISVACKALGFAADIYWNSDRSKYDQSDQGRAPNQNKPIKWDVFWAECAKLGYTKEQVLVIAKVESLGDWDKGKLDKLYRDLKDARATS